MARQTNGAPACPKPERLEELMDFLTDLKRTESEVEGGDYNLNLQSAVEALDWLHTYLSNRNIYHKKQQLKKKVLLAVMKEKLGDDLLDVEEQAEKLANNQLSDYVADGR